MEESILNNNLEESDFIEDNLENEIISDETVSEESNADEITGSGTVHDETAETEDINGEDDKDRIEEMIEQGSEEELMKLKSWLFRENVRIIMATKELEEMQAQFNQEKEQFQEEVKALNRKISVERQRLKEDSLFFEKKMDILKSGFAQLDMDRRRLEKEQAKFEAQREVLEQPSYGMGRDVSAFFRGVKNPLALKKRYKDLIKIFHPDNVAGDKEIIQMINKEYENLKHDYEIGKWA